jgi:hypothetical protein
VKQDEAKVPAAVGGILAGGGEVGALMRQMDWEATPLGPPERWPQSLRTAVSILLDSRYPMFLFWGPELVKIYNDGYRPITGAKHPWALGRPGREVWPEIWDTIGPMVDRVVQHGEATWSADLLLFMARNGFPEEVYFTFSYSPIRDESGGVGGMFCACTETTEKVLGDRRLVTLRDLAAAPAETDTTAKALGLSCEVLGKNPADVPVRAAVPRRRRRDRGTSRQRVRHLGRATHQPSRRGSERRRPLASGPGRQDARGGNGTGGSTSRRTEKRRSGRSAQTHPISFSPT